jgi:regulator of sirC expression with transglutaminase-like and TPR domain
VSPAPLPRARGLAAGSLVEALQLPEEEIDIGRAALLAAGEGRPEFDVDLYLRRLDDLGARVRRRVTEGTTIDAAVRELVAVVQPSGARAEELTSAARAGPGLPPELDLARILDGEKGNCLGLGLLYLAVAERVGLPVAGVSAPGHFFVRFDDGVTCVNIEPTLGGRAVSNRSYRESRHISPEAEERGIYLRSESKRQVLASLVANRAGYRALAGELDEALADSERALAVKPYWPQAYVNRGLALELGGRLREAEADYRKALSYDPRCAGALNNMAALYVRSVGDADAPPLGSLATAEWMASEALKYAGSRPELHETAAAVAAAQGKLRAARRQLACAVRLDPTNPRYRRALEEIEKRMRRGGGDDRDGAPPETP